MVFYKFNHQILHSQLVEVSGQLTTNIHMHRPCYCNHFLIGCLLGGIEFVKVNSSSINHCRSNYHDRDNWGPINWFNPATFVCLSQVRTWVSICKCCSVFVFSDRFTLYLRIMSRCTCMFLVCIMGDVIF